MRPLVLFLLVTLPAALAWRWPGLEKLGISLMGFDASDTCGYTRDDALLCIAKYVDTNGDKEISAAEFEAAKRAYLPRQARMAAWVARRMGYDISIADVMKGCDVDGDGRLTLSDWEHGEKVCLPGAADLCKMQTVCKIAENMNKKDKRT